MHSGISWVLRTEGVIVLMNYVGNKELSHINFEGVELCRPGCTLNVNNKTHQFVIHVQGTSCRPFCVRMQSVFVSYVVFL